MPVGCFKQPHKRPKGFNCQVAQDSSQKTGVPDTIADSNVVTLSRKSDDDLLGLLFSGGVDKQDKPHITNLRSGGLAARSDGLQNGDYIISINGINVEKMKYEEIVTLLKHTGSVIEVEVSFSLPPRAPQSVYSVKCKKASIALTKEDNSLGLVIRGGVHVNKMKSRPLTVTSIRAAGPAHRNGKIRVGDRIIAINGVNVITSSLGTARRLISTSNDVIHLVIEYDIAIMDTVQNADGPLLVEVGRKGSLDLGITLSQRIKDGKSYIVIEDIQTASIAERCGALHIGDIILAIDGVDMNNISKAEADHHLISSQSKILQLEILPVGHLYEQHPRDRQYYKNTHTKEARYSNPSSGAPSSVCPLDHSFYSVFSDELGNFKATSTTQYPTQHKYHINSNLQPPKSKLWRQPSIRSIGSITSTSGHSIMCHEETMDVCLFANHVGLGIVLHSNTLPSEVLCSPPFIGILESSGSADRCGILQEGDRILSINGTDLIGHSISECKMLLEESSSSKCILTVAFDIADGVTPGNGTYQVKLFKRGGTLGLTLAEDRNEDHRIIISDVKKGSAAYRSGAIHTGDELISIDNLNLDNCSVDDAHQILQNTDEIVKLKLRKSTSNKCQTQRGTDGDSGLVFTVEIPKVGQSLGLTISGKELPDHPIIISEITPGGVADKIGALRVGDQLLGINGRSIQGTAVSYAIQLLKSAVSIVKLKVFREHTDSLKSQEHHLKPIDNRFIQSGDSALESWDSAPSPVSKHQSDDRNVMLSERKGDDWTKMIHELENVGKAEISGILNAISTSTNERNPSTSSPQDGSRPLPEACLPEIPSHSELLAIQIKKESHETFGFGLSNAMYSYQQGCYICAVGSESPADRAGLLKYDRLIQVNDIDVRCASCNEIVPLIETACSTLSLVVIRKRKGYTSDSSENTRLSSIGSHSRQSSLNSFC